MHINSCGYVYLCVCAHKFDERIHMILFNSILPKLYIQQTQDEGVSEQLLTGHLSQTFNYL